jgi:hypothetical protein
MFVQAERLRPFRALARSHDFRSILLGLRQSRESLQPLSLPLLALLKQMRVALIRQLLSLMLCAIRTDGYWKTSSNTSSIFTFSTSSVNRSSHCRRYCGSSILIQLHVFFLNRHSYFISFMRCKTLHSWSITRYRFWRRSAPAWHPCVCPQKLISEYVNDFGIIF